MLADLRESGSIEQDADVVLFLYATRSTTRCHRDPGHAEVIVAKHRNGPTGTTRLAFIRTPRPFRQHGAGVGARSMPDRWPA